MMQLTTSMSRADGRAGAAIVSRDSTDELESRPRGPFQRNNSGTVAGSWAGWQRAAFYQ